MAGGANPAQTQRTPNVFQQSAGNLAQAGKVTSNVIGRNLPTMNAQTYDAQTVGGQDMSGYMNPYTSGVIDTTMADMDRARQMTQNQNGAAASAAGAFGGSRHGLVEAETNRAFADQAGQMAAGLRQNAFSNAQGMALNDANAVNQASQFNTGNQQQAQIQNQAAKFQNRSMDLQGAAQLGNLSNLGFGMGQQINSTMSQQGAQQQAAMQALIDAGKGQFQGFTGAPQQALQPLLAALGASPQPTSTTNTKNPGMLDYISLGLGMG